MIIFFPIKSQNQKLIFEVNPNYKTQKQKKQFIIIIHKAIKNIAKIRALKKQT
jgi:hypothetical protein